MRRIALLAAGLAALLPLSAPLAAQAAAPRDSTALVLFIAVDQLRPDYLVRWRGQLGGGLGRLVREGIFFRQGRQDHAITQTAPGHSTMLSGRFPAHTGIVTNERGVPDPRAPVIGAPDAPGASPRRFEGTALFDWMHARDPDARVLSLSRKDRGAILPVGKALGEVYWYAGGAGGFTTSRYYRDALPAWLTAWNARGGVARLAGTEWTLLLPDSAYAEPDSQPWENEGRDIVFPHRLPTTPDSIRRRIIDYPVMDSLTLDAALDGVRQLGLGRRGRPDLVAVSLSTVDHVGHAYGPDSRELHDQVLRTDRWLGWFLDSLATLVPRERTIVALTADHGVQSVPAYVRAVEHRASRPLWLGAIARDLDTTLRARYRADFDVDFDYGLLFADVAALRARGVNVDSLADALAARARREPDILRVYTPRTLAAAPAADSLARRWRHTIAPGTGWLFAAVPEAGYPWSRSEDGNHGTPAGADVAVPIIFLIPGRKPAAPATVVRTVDIAPTLAALLGLRPTEPLDGRPLAEVVGTPREAAR